LSSNTHLTALIALRFKIFLCYLQYTCNCTAVLQWNNNISHEISLGEKLTPIWSTTTVLICLPFGISLTATENVSHLKGN